MKISYSKGVSAVEVILLVAVLAIGGGLGYVYLTKVNGPKAADSSQTEDAARSPEVSTIGSSSDIDKATSELDAMDVEDSSDSNTLSSESAQF